MSPPSSPESYRNLRQLVKLWPWLKPETKQIAIGSIMIPIVAVVSMLQPLLLKRAIDEGILVGNFRITLTWASVCLGLSILSYIFSGIQTISTSLAVHKMIFSLRHAVMRHVLNLPASWHDSQISGALATRATSDFDTLSESLNQGVLSSVIDIIVLLGCIVGMFILSFKLALIAIIILPCMIWLVSWFSKKLNVAMLSSRRHLAALNGFTQEAITSLSAVKLLNAEAQVSDRYRGLNTLYRNAQLENVFFDALMFAAIDGISSITLGLSLFVAIRWTGLTDDLTAGLMVAFVQYIGQLFEPLKQLGTKMAMLQGALTSIERIFGLLDIDKKVQGTESIDWPKRVAVEFKNVCFTYKEGSKNILDNVNFKLPEARSLAIIGRTGSGKSTIAKLLTKLYDGYQGTIEIGGSPIANLNPEFVRGRIGIVPQDIVLFEGTIAFNISLGDDSVTIDQITRAANLVGADDFINNFPDKLNYVVKEGGSNLSQGQRQLIVFARALIKDPPIVILDEATSSVDPQSEAIVQEATSKLFRDRTVIVIAHRLETIKKCDLLLALEDGKVVELGPPKDLSLSKGRYKELLSFATANT